MSYGSPIARSYVALFTLLLGVLLFPSCDKEESDPKPTSSTYKLTLTPPTDGKVSGDKATYKKDELTHITASANNGYKFQHWKGVPEGSKMQNPLKLKMTANLALEAVFGASANGMAITTDANGETLKAAAFSKGGETYVYNGKTYTIAADKAALAEALEAGKDMSLYITTKVTDMSELFKGKASFNQDISKWDVSNVTDMRNMFNYAHAFNQDISKWDVSKVTDMGLMFYSLEEFNQDISKWDVSKVTDMRLMFAYAEAFNQNLSKWDVSKVTDMWGMFVYAQAFNQDISKWDVSQVTDMRLMFFRAVAFNQDLSGWCVEKIKTKPGDFDYNYNRTTAWSETTGRKPIWGTCPK